MESSVDIAIVLREILLKKIVFSGLGMSFLCQRYVTAFDAGI